MLALHQTLGLSHSAVCAEQRAEKKPPALASEEEAGEDAWRPLADAVPVSGVSAGDPERGGASSVSGAMLLLGQHSGLSRASAAQRAQKYPPQHGETVSMGSSSAPHPGLCRAWRLEGPSSTSPCAPGSLH